MNEITVRVCGDHWLNPQEVMNDLLSSQDSKCIVLKLGSEGASLRALGIVDMVENWCRFTNRDISTVYVTEWGNSIEPVPFTRLHTSRASHFIWMSERYQCDLRPNTHQYRYGLFIGRRTVPRTIIVYDMFHTMRDQTLFSVMNSVTNLPWEVDLGGIDLDSFDDWSVDVEKIKTWWKTPLIHSIDGHSISDQYNSDFNTNASLLSHYHKFDIEIVCETYTHGVTFFPTEKTIRPLLAGKPMLIYGPRGFLKNLRMMGFRTWDTLWDESYDDLQGAQRWAEMKKLVIELTNKTLDYQDISLYNQRHLLELSKKYRPG